MLGHSFLYILPDIQSKFHGFERDYIDIYREIRKSNLPMKSTHTEFRLLAKLYPKYLTQIISTSNNRPAWEALSSPLDRC